MLLGGVCVCVCMLRRDYGFDKNEKFDLQFTSSFCSVYHSSIGIDLLLRVLVAVSWSNIHAQDTRVYYLKTARIESFDRLLSSASSILFEDMDVYALFILCYYATSEVSVLQCIT